MTRAYATTGLRFRRTITLLVAVGLSAFGSLAAAPHAHADTSFGVWVGSSGPGTTTVDDGTSGPPSFHYDDEQAGFSPVNWSFSTMETQTAPDDNGLTESVPWQYTGLHAWFAVTVNLQAFIQTSEGTQTFPLVNAGPANCCTAPSNGFSYQGTYQFTGLQQGDTYGFTFGGSNFDSNNFLQGTLSLFGNGPVIAAPSGNTSWENAKALSANDSVSSDSITAPGEDRWYTVPVVPDSQVAVSLSGLSADADVTVFSDISQAFQADLNTFGDGNADAQSLTALAAQQPTTTAAPAEFSPSAFTPSAFTPSAFTPSAFTPSAFTPSAFTPSAFTPSAFTPSAFTPSAFTPSAFTPSAFTPSAFTPSAFTAAYSSAQVRSLLAVSSQSGVATKTATVNTWNATGHFYIRVSGHNGAYSPTPYTLTVATSGGPCDNATLSTFSSDSTIGAPPGDQSQTLILTDSSRLSSPDLSTALQALATRTNGTIADLADSQRVQDLQAQANTYSSCPYASNLVANAIRDIVTSYRAGGQLKYVVIVGSDSVVPFFRYADTAGLAPETGYVPPLSSTSRTGAALESDDYLTDDPYGAATILTTQNADLPVPDLAVGRLVENPAEITGQIDQYLDDPNGTLPTPKSSLVTGYDFLQPVADDVESAFEAGMDDPNGTPAEHDQLITNQGVPPTTTTASGTGRNYSWTANDLSNALLGSHHDVVFLGGHFSANNTLAADYSTTLVTTDLQNAVQAKPNLFANTLVISAGCHGGYNIQSADGVPGVTLGLDWPEAFGAAGATLISGTGYQYGDTDFVAYSDKLDVDLAQQLHAGTGSLPIGQALVAAKQQYLQQVAQLSGMDTKALLQTTLYGLPMLGVNMPFGRAPASTPTTGTITPTAVTSDPGAALGLEEDDLATTSNLHEQHEPVTDLSGTLPSGSQYTWLSGPDGVVTQPGQPTLPLQSVDVTPTDNTVLRGVGFWSGTYVDEGGTIPLVGEPATELGQVHAPFESPVFFPQTLWTPNYYGALSGSGGTALQLTPAQVEADGANTDVLRRYDDLDLHLFYSGNTAKYGDNVPALAAAPTISQVSSEVNPDGTISVSAHVAGDPSAGVDEVWVTYTGASAGDPDHGRWRSLDLTQNGNDSTLWTGTVTPTDPTQAPDVRFLVQAVNGVGVVALDDNGGGLYVPGTMPGFSPSGATASTLTLSGGDSSGTYGGSAQVAAVLDGASGAPLPNRTIAFSVDKVTVSGTTDATGRAQVSLPLLASPGPVTLSATFGGNAGSLPSSDSRDFTITPPATNLTIHPAPGSQPDVVDGADTGVTATLTSNGQPLAGKSVFFLVTDSSGNPVSSTLRTTDGTGTAAMGALAVAPGVNTVVASFDQSGVQVGGAVVDAVDSGYLGSSATTTLHGIEPTHTTLAADATSPTYGTPVTLTATVTPSGGTGTVQFTAADGSTLPNCGARPLSHTPSGDVATCPVAGWDAGSHTSSAAFSGAPDYRASSSGTVAVTVGKANTTTALSAPATVTYGKDVTLSATVTTTASGAAPSGTVTFTRNGSAVGQPVALGTNGTASLTLSGQDAGSYTFAANYSGDIDHAGSTATSGTAVSAVTTVTTIGVTGSATYGAPDTLSATVGPAHGGPVTFTVDGVTACHAVALTSTSNGGVATCIDSALLSVGAHSIAAAYGGDTDNQASSGSGTLTVGQSATAVALSAPATTTCGESLQLTATVTSISTGTTPSGVAPSGTVTFYDGTVQLGASVPVSANGTASFSLPRGAGQIPGAGRHSWRAVYSGDGNYAGASSSAATTIRPAATTTVLSTTSPVVFGQPVTLSAAVTPTDSGGQLAFYMDGSTTAACVRGVTVSGSSGTASCAVGGLSIGTHHVTVTFSHDANLINSSAGADVKVGVAPTATTLVAPATPTFGAPVPLSVSVAPVAPGAGSPKGTVTFYNGARVIGTATLTTHTGPSTASLTVKGLLGGPRALSAVYGGSSSFTGSSGGAAVTVSFTKTITSGNAVTVASGQALLVSGTVNGAVTVQAGGALDVTGTVNGNIGSSGAKELEICGGRVNGRLTVAGSTGFVFVGGDGCAASSVNGVVSITNGTGGVEVAGTTVNGAVTVNGNSGLGPSQIGGVFPPPLLTGNKINGKLACATNSPAPSDKGAPNTATARSGQCATPANF